MVKDKGTGQQLPLVPVWHRTAPALGPGGAEPKPTMVQGEIAEVTLFGPETGKPGLLGVKSEGPIQGVRPPTEISGHRQGQLLYN